MIDIRLQENLELMAEIQSNSVDLIYSDILYGTGRNFGDYQDLKSNETEINTFYYPRIKEMYRILKPTGSIYLQMDTRINHWLRMILDKIFGYENFRNEIIWHYSNKPSMAKKIYSKNHDVILFYSKDENYIFNTVYIPIKESTKKRYTRDITNIKGGKRIDNVGLKPATDVIDDVFFKRNQFYNESVGYATQKPIELIKRIILSSSNENDLVADFFAGSFTTAEACKDLNRKFIGCDISQKAVEIGLKRCGLNCL